MPRPFKIAPVEGGARLELYPILKYEDRYNRRHGLTVFTQAKVIRETPMSNSRYSVIKWHWKEQPPKRSECLILARWFDIPVEEVLHDFQLGGLDALVSFMEAHPELDSQMSILEWLHFAASSEKWQALQWQANIFKENAEYYLTRDEGEYQRARGYASTVSMWAADPYRDVPMHMRTTETMDVATILAS